MPVEDHDVSVMEVLEPLSATSDHHAEDCFVRTPPLCREDEDRPLLPGLLRSGAEREADQYQVSASHQLS